MGTWSTSAPSNLATGWTKVGQSSEVTCWYVGIHSYNSTTHQWENTWFNYVMQVVCWIARTTDNKAVQCIELYVNDGKTTASLGFYPVATDSSGEVVGSMISNEPRTSSLTKIATRYYTTTNNKTPDTLTFGVYTNAREEKGSGKGDIPTYYRINARVSCATPVLKGATPWVKVNGSWVPGNQIYIKVNGKWVEGLVKFKDTGTWKL